MTDAAIRTPAWHCGVRRARRRGFRRQCDDFEVRFMLCGWVESELRNLNHTGSIGLLVSSESRSPFGASSRTRSTSRSGHDGRFVAQLSNSCYACRVLTGHGGNKNGYQGHHRDRGRDRPCRYCLYGAFADRADARGQCARSDADDRAGSACARAEPHASAACSLSWRAVALIGRGCHPVRAELSLH